MPKITLKNDYNDMRLISDELHARLVQILAQDEKVKAFQQLLLAKHAEPDAMEPDKITTSEGEENGIQ